MAIPSLAGGGGAAAGGAAPAAGGGSLLDSLSLDSLSSGAKKVNPIVDLLHNLGGGHDQGGGMAMPPMQMPSMMPDVAAPQGPPPLSLMRAYQMQM